MRASTPAHPLQLPPCGRDYGAFVNFIGSFYGGKVRGGWQDTNEVRGGWQDTIGSCSRAVCARLRQQVPQTCTGDTAADSYCWCAYLHPAVPTCCATPRRSALDFAGLCGRWGPERPATCTKRRLQHGGSWAVWHKQPGAGRRLACPPHLGQGACTVSDLNPVSWEAFNSNQASSIESNCCTGFLLQIT